jgi:hypothetical protein
MSPALLRKGIDQNSHKTTAGISVRFKNQEEKHATCR